MTELNDLSELQEVLPTVEELHLSGEEKKLKRETLLLINEVILDAEWKDVKDRILQIIDDQEKKRRICDVIPGLKITAEQHLSQGPLTSTATTHLHASVGENQESNAYDRPASIVSLSNDAQQSDSSEYDEISDADINVLVQKHIDDAAIAEMNHKFQVLKMILENVSNEAEIREHFIQSYTELATWCEVRINASVMMYFVNKFHDECQTYIFEQYRLKIDIKKYEEEILRRTENPSWTDAQKLKRRVLKRRRTQPHKKKLGKERVESLFSRLMQENIEMTKHSAITKQSIRNLTECSKSKYNFFTSVLQKYDKHNELSDSLNKVLVEKWLEFLYLLPQNGYGEEATVSEYLNIRKELNLQVSDGAHITLLNDVHELFKLKREEEQMQKRYYDAAQSRQVVEQQRYLCMPDAASRGRCQGQRTLEAPHPKPSSTISIRQEPRAEQRLQNLRDQAYIAHSPFY